MQSCEHLNIHVLMLVIICVCVCLCAIKAPTLYRVRIQQLMSQDTQILAWYDIDCNEYPRENDSFPTYLSNRNGFGGNENVASDKLNVSNKLLSIYQTDLEKKQ